MKYTIFAIVLMNLLACTQNQRARHWGGTETLTLPANHKLINATWKDGDLWILSQDTVTKQVTFWEKSSWGLMNGKIIIK